jgi:hypothetical protein
MFRVKHGPQTWPWWRLASVSVIRASGVILPSTGYNVWLYTRWGAYLLGVYFDRRN